MVGLRGSQKIHSLRADPKGPNGPNPRARSLGPVLRTGPMGLVQWGYSLGPSLRSMQGPS